MERYVILMIAVTIAGVITQQKNAGGVNFDGPPRKDGKIIAAIATCENCTDHSHIFASYSQFKVSTGVLPEKEICQTTICKKSVQKIIKNWRRDLNKMSGSTDPGILFNNLRPLPVGEPYFIH